MSGGGKEELDVVMGHGSGTQHGQKTMSVSASALAAGECIEEQPLTSPMSVSANELPSHSDPESGSYSVEDCFEKEDEEDSECSHSASADCSASRGKSPLDLCIVGTRLEAGQGGPNPNEQLQEWKHLIPSIRDEAKRTGYSATSWDEELLRLLLAQSASVHSVEHEELIKRLDQKKKRRQRSNSTGKGSRRSQRRKSGANSSCNDSEPRAESASSSDHALPHTGSSCSLPMIGEAEGSPRAPALDTAEQRRHSKGPQPERMLMLPRMAQASPLSARRCERAGCPPESEQSLPRLTPNGTRTPRV